MTRRNDIHELLLLVEPFIVGRLEQVRLLLDVIIPSLNNKDHFERESFIKLVEAIDEFRAASPRPSDSKYDAEYFRNKWE